MKIDVSSYAIGGISSQLTLDGLGRQYPVVFFSQWMISAKIRYETHNKELLAIIKAFMTWKHYLEDCNHEVLILIDYNNLYYFMDTKSLSSRQVFWTQKLSRYYFWIDYQQDKANRAANGLSQYTQQSAKKEKTFQAKNINILY